MSKPILIVGCGSIGQRHLRCLLKTARARVAICETNSALLEKVTASHQVPGFATLQEALSTRAFEGVVICTPAPTHIPIALTVLKSGAGLLIEKPLSVGLDQIDVLKSELARVRSFAGVGYVYHFVPAVQRAREFLVGGTLGKPLQISVVCGQHFPTFRPAYRDTYYTRHESGGGAIQDALTHVVNTVEWLVGPTTRVACEAKHQFLEGVTVEDTVGASARNGEVLVTYSLNQFQAPNEMSLQIHCEHGSLKIDVHEQRWAVFARGASAWDFRPAPVNERDDLFLAQAHAFLDGLEGKPNLLCTLDEAVQTLKFNLAALESARTGQTITIA
jgi:predicted dehydrogenase